MIDLFLPFQKWMIEENLPRVSIDTFRYYYQQLIQGETGVIREKDILPVDSLPDSETFGADLSIAGQAALSRTVVIKLNGGLGTGMGLEKAKSLLKVKEGFSFLDIIARQAMKSHVPLVLMNSFSTREESLSVLKKYPALSRVLIPFDFLQHKAPKITQDGFLPLQVASHPELEWYPLGHGDLYAALVTSGMLDQLLSVGIETAFVSNADNLGATLDASLLGFFTSNQLPFMMECADRTEADKKGGHLAQGKDGHLLLREFAQCEKEDQNAFQDVMRYKFFNTNNLWINLKFLKQILTERNNILQLPMIRNSKTADPRDSGSTPVYQLETAMGSAIAVIPGATAVRVPKTRFAPVKTCEDLLAVRSDAYVLTQNDEVVLNPKRKGQNIVIHLDSRFYKMVDQFEARFPEGIPSLLECRSLEVRGDFRFGKNVVIKNDVVLSNQTDQQMVIKDNAIIS